MKISKTSIELTEYEYSVLKNNSLISLCCKQQLNTATKNKEGVRLSLTYSELEDLIGFVAAESNHARTRRKQEDLGSICDYLESFENNFSKTDEFKK
jgi:hypothetical protein